MYQNYLALDEAAAKPTCCKLFYLRCPRLCKLSICLVACAVFSAILILIFFKLEVTCVPPKLQQPAVPGESPTLPAAGALLVQTACATGDRLARQPDMEFADDFSFEGPTIEVNLSKRDQKVIGFGAALTPASATVFKDLKPELQQKFLDAYYGQNGIGYTLGRIPINSCDFSPVSYSFDDVDGDFDLKYFDSGLEQEISYQIPFITKVSEAVAANGHVLKLLASPWSPPAWMKTNHVMMGVTKDFLFGLIKFGVGSLREECRSTWANYISKWLDAYKAHGIKVWAITVQNEPSNSPSWEGCILEPRAEADFLGNFLGPVLHERHPELKIFAGDGQTKQSIPERASTIYAHPTASKYADGLAFHWYGDVDFRHIESVHHKFPQSILLATEATYESGYWNYLGSERSGIWRYGEGYAQDIIGDLNAGAAGWLDWNILLNHHGGPNHVGNNCDASEVANLEEQELWTHPQYYYMGHFSKYVLPNSTRLGINVVGQPSVRRSFGDWLRAMYYAYGYCAEQSGLQATSFLRQDDIVVAVVLNCAPTDVEFKLRFSAGANVALRASIPAHGIQTYLFKQGIGS